VLVVVELVVDAGKAGDFMLRFTIITVCALSTFRIGMP